MLEKSTLTKEKMLLWLKKYLPVLLVGAVLIAFAIIVSVVAFSGREPEKVETSSTMATTFYTPVTNYTVAKDYVGDSLVYNATLKQWEAHKSIDLKVAEGSSVYSCLAGTVTSVTENYLHGTVIEITHDNGLVTRYSSLEDEPNVKVGDKVSSGQKIGTATTSAGASDLGTHLTLEVLSDGVAVDPNQYLSFSNK